MQFYKFPEIKDCDEDGLMAISEEINPDMTISAYLQGIFPWPIESVPQITWFSPNPRGIIEFEDLHIPKRLARTIRQNKFQVKQNKAFNDVISYCKNIKRKGEQGTWITDQIKTCYQEMFLKHYAYSFETYQDNKLVGGVYGVKIGKFVSGESMFHLKSDSSKVALVLLIESLKNEGFEWMDIQMLTPITKTLGGKEITRDEFLMKLKTTLASQDLPI